MIAAFDRLIEAFVDLLPIAAFFIALAVITKGRGLREDWRKGRGETLTNLWLTVFDTLVVLPLVVFPAYWLAQSLNIQGALGFLWQDLPVWIVVVAAITLGDLVGYWRHRLEHSRLLWPVHATHHSDEAMNWLSLNRMHPFNRLTTVTIDVTVLLALGFPPIAVLANNIVRNWWGFFVHADVPWTLGPLGKVFISPAAHKVHHAKPLELSGANFATVFTFWDRLFGTWRKPDDLIGVPTGIGEGSRGFLGELIRPFHLWFGNASQENEAPETAQESPQASA